MKVTKENLEKARVVLEERRNHLEVAKSLFWMQSGAVAIMQSILSEEEVEDGKSDTKTAATE